MQGTRPSKDVKKNIQIWREGGLFKTTQKEGYGPTPHLVMRLTRL